MAELQKAFHAMAFIAPLVEVRGEIKSNLMARVDAAPAAFMTDMRMPKATTGVSTEHWLSRGFKLFVTSAVAAGIAVVATHAVMMGRVRELQQLNEQIGSALDFSQKQNVALQEDVTRHGADVHVLQAADLRLVNLAAEPNQPGGACRLFFATGTEGGLLVVRDAPPAPSGRVYELWLIDGASKKTAAGTFNVGPDGSARVPLKLAAAVAESATIVAVTDEPPGGDAQPTGSIRFSGKVR